MLKRILSLVLAVTILLTATGFAYVSAETVKTSEMSSAIAVATAYLEESTYARYYYDRNDAGKFTIAALPESENTALMQKIEGYTDFRANQEVVPYEETNIASGTLNAMTDNLSLHQNSVAYYAYINEMEGITYKYFTPSYDVVESIVDGNLATVNIYETLDFQYSDCEEPSMMRTHYLVSLVKHNAEWYVMAVESDDLFYETYRESGFDLNAEIEGVKAAYSQNLAIDSNIMSASVATDVELEVTSASSTDREYNAQNAAMYALTYSTSTDSGSTPSYRNEKFYWTSASCQLFVSQCLWAGFGGSNTQADINNRRGMDTTGSYQWWSTKTRYNNPEYNDEGSLDDKGWNSWVKCSQFRTYVNGVKNSSSESGVVCETYDVAYNSNDMVGSSGLTKEDLIGAALHVKGSSGALGHAIIVNNATGTTRSTVYYTSYNNCAKNIKLSTGFPSSSTNTKCNIFVMVPRYLRGANGASTNYVYARLENAMVMGTSGFTRTLYGYAHSEVPTMVMHVYAPGDSTISYTFTSTNSTEVSGSVLFNEVGEWKVVVMGTGLDAFTYLIRIV